MVLFVRLLRCHDIEIDRLRSRATRVDLIPVVVVVLVAEVVCCGHETIKDFDVVVGGESFRLFRHLQVLSDVAVRAELLTLLGEEVGIHCFAHFQFLSTHQYRRGFVVVI